MLVDYLMYRWPNHDITFYTTYISADLAHYEILHAQVGKGGIKPGYVVDPNFRIFTKKF